MAAYRQALRISPREPNVANSHMGLTFAALMLGRAEEAVAHSVRAVASNPDYPHAHASLAAHLALTGRMDEARAALREFRSRLPAATAADRLRWFREESERPLFLAARQRELEALRAIGLPQG
jgi:Flp pilus assembly protein TadD